MAMRWFRVGNIYLHDPAMTYVAASHLSSSIESNGEPEVEVGIGGGFHQVKAFTGTDASRVIDWVTAMSVERRDEPAVTGVAAEAGVPDRHEYVLRAQGALGDD